MTYNNYNGYNPNSGHNPNGYNAGPNPNYGYNNPGGYPPGTGNNLNNIGPFDEGPTGKSRGVAGLLAIFLGTLGIQYFYLGKTTAGILAIVLSLVSCGALSILWLIQGIMMIAMSESEFERKFIYSASSFPLF